MKIGILGNMNNMPFALTRYLRDMGYDCELLIFKNEPGHFRPSSDTHDEAYKKYCKTVSWGDPADFLKQDFSIVKKDLEPYQFLIGHGPAPAYVTKINRYLDLFIPYGYDLFSLSSFRIVHPFRIPPYWALRRYQVKGIQNSRHTLFDKTNRGFEQVFKKLKIEGQRVICPHPMIYDKEYEREQYPDSNKWLQLAKRLREENDFLVVQHGRQIWKKSPDKWSYKGNDHLIKGYSKFIKQHPEKKSRLILFEYGSDVQASKELIDRLHIAGNITWLPQMDRIDFMYVLSLADLIVGELHHSWLTYGVVMEALFSGKPLMHKRIDREYDMYSWLYPNFYADSEETVVAGLTKIAANNMDLKEIGRKGREWFDEFCVTLPLNIIEGFIKEKQGESI
jgi:hypothetical protein